MSLLEKRYIAVVTYYCHVNDINYECRKKQQNAITGIISSYIEFARQDLKFLRVTSIH